MNYDWDLIFHDAQAAIFDDSARFRVSCSGRRFGKSNLALQELVYAALSFSGELSTISPQMVVGCLPTAVQARQILFKPLVNLFTTTSLKYVVDSINLAEMRINILGKPSIRIVGANDKGGDRLRGMRIYFMLMDEVQDVLPQVWSEVVRPAMSDTPGSRALFTGTPKGTANILFYLSENAKSDPEWSFHNYPTSANPTIPRIEIETAKRQLPPRVFEQEYEAKFTTFPGQIYTELDSNNLYEGDLPYFDLVVAGVDWGSYHPAISVVGREPRTNTWYFLAGWSPNTSGGDAQPVLKTAFEEKLREMVDEYKIDLILCDPAQPSEILAIRKMGTGKAYQSASAGFNGIESGILQVHKLIHQNRLLFVKNTDSRPEMVTGQRAYDFHLSYHYESKRGVVTDTPADGDLSHICDATRYALAIRGQ